MFETLINYNNLCLFHWKKIILARRENFSYSVKIDFLEKKTWILCLELSDDERMETINLPVRPELQISGYAVDQAEVVRFKGPSSEKNVFENIKWWNHLEEFLNKCY